MPAFKTSFAAVLVLGLLAPSATARTLILAHYMPWFQAKPTSPNWGRHWTMNAFDPEKIKDGKRSIASHFSPTIGPYDSSDPALIEYHLLLMKTAGIDGVIVDWYGRQEFRDYPALHRATMRLIEATDRLKMKFAICYEDQTIPTLVEGGKIKAEARVTHAAAELEWLARNWFKREGYARIEGRPVLLSFGQTGLTDAEWSLCLKGLSSPLAYFSQHRVRPGAMGAFDWPLPSEGAAASDRFNRTFGKGTAIPVAFPRFVDIYAQANVHKSWGNIPDRQGETYRKSLDAALSLKPPIVQLATWNDWGEGTMIEPSLEFGFRDLQATREARRKHVDPAFSNASESLKLPGRLLALRRAGTAPAAELDRIAGLIAALDFEAAEKAIAARERK